MPIGPVLVRALFRGRPDADTRQGLALRYPWPVWLAAVGAFVVTHSLLFGVVHIAVDMRACLGHSPDPILSIVPYDDRWTFVTRQLYTTATLGAAALLLVQALRGAHAPVLRWGLGLAFMSSMRMVTLLLIPLCRPTVAAGGPPPLAAPTMLDLGLVEVPWRIFALNDLVYSGHTSVFLLLLFATRTWAPAARLSVGGFLALLVYGLLAMRDHYSVDIMLALPCSYFADAMAAGLLRIANASRRTVVAAALAVPAADYAVSAPNGLDRGPRRDADATPTSAGHRAPHD